MLHFLLTFLIALLPLTFAQATATTCLVVAKSPLSYQFTLTITSQPIPDICATRVPTALITAATWYDVIVSAKTCATIGTTTAISATYIGSDSTVGFLPQRNAFAAAVFEAFGKNGLKFVPTQCAKPK